MRMTFSVRHGDVPDRLRQHAESEVEGLSKYFDRLVEADIILDQEGHRHIAEVRIHTSTDTHFAASAADEWRKAIDATVDKLRRQLKRHKEKLEQRRSTRGERERALQGSSDGSGSAPAAAAPQAWDRLSRDEAVARLEEQSGEDVLVFVDVTDEAVKIARRDEAGSVSVVEADAYEIGER
ncbi:MAG TPA: ribosome-associated translation inhibitor RaiA [Gemmatimonadota bacterium]|nr:ribosome-associated translation inhibitor RaiA [Gemmatimonadota bacterium]